jgi:SAM-dependent methyltransferase
MTDATANPKMKDLSVFLKQPAEEPRLVDPPVPERVSSQSFKNTFTFYVLLRQEVTGTNPYLNHDEQLQLQSHYERMLNPQRYPPGLAATIYSNRRRHGVQFISETENPIVFDAGCGYGSESFLFAYLGAKVVAVDVSADQMRIAMKRQRYYEELFGKPLDINFVAADLEEYTPEMTNLSLTWSASVLAAVRNQNKFLEKIYKATRPKGQIMITDQSRPN